MSKQQEWIEWVRKSPGWSLGAIGLISAIVAFLVLFKDNFHLAATVTITVCFLALLLLCIYLAFTKTPPLVHGGRGLYRFERVRRWTLAGIVLIPVLGIAILVSSSGRNFVSIAFFGTPTTATATATFTLTIVPTDAPTATFPTRISVTLPESQRKDIYLTYLCALWSATMASDEGKTFAPDNAQNYAADLVISGYGIKQGELDSIIGEGERENWREHIPVNLLTNAVFWAFEENRLPTMGECRTSVGDRTIRQEVIEAADEMAVSSYPSESFDTAITTLSKISSSFSTEEIEYLIDAYIQFIHEEYQEFELYFVGPRTGYFLGAHEQIYRILEQHQDTVRQILEERINSENVEVATLAVRLLGYYGNTSTVAKLEAIKHRFEDDTAYPILIKAVITSLAEKD